MTLCVDILTLPWRLALSRKRVSEQVRLALRIQGPDTVVGLESWNAAYLSLVFHDFIAFFHHSLDDGLRSRIF